MPPFLRSTAKATAAMLVCAAATGDEPEGEDPRRPTVLQALEDHERDPNIPWHCKCNTALGSHADPELDAHHRGHVTTAILTALDVLTRR